MNYQVFLLLLKLLAHHPQPSKREQSLLKIIELQNEKIAILKKRLPKKPRLTWPERLRLSNLARSIPSNIYIDLVYHLWKPKTVLSWVKRWQRNQAYKEKQNSRKGGRPCLNQETKDEIIKLYNNGIQSLRRIAGELKKCNIHVSKSSVANVLIQNGLTPNGRSKDTWSAFIKRHAQHIAATDFFTVPVGILGKIVNYDVLFIIEHDTRKVHLLGLTTYADSFFMNQVARNITMDEVGCLNRRKYLIHDNDTKFCNSFKKTLKQSGIETKATAIMAPKMNAHAERFIRSIKEEYLNKYIFFNEEMLRKVINTYIDHYNNERPHQGIGNNTITKWTHQNNNGNITIDEHLGGVLKSARRLAT